MTVKRIDYALLIVALILVSFGILMVFSSSYYYAIDQMQNKLHFFINDLKWVAVGIVVMIVASVVPYSVYRKLAIPALIISISLLVYVLFNGVVINNARRWIIVAGQQFMPAEIAKMGVIFFFAYALEKNHMNLNKFSVLGVYLSLLILFVFLIMEQPNMSTAIIIAGVMAIMIFTAGLHWLYVALIGTGSIFAGWFFVNSASYRLERFTAFLNPFEHSYDEAYQVVQSLYALGTGGIFGVGMGMSTQNKLYIPEPQNDFILATIGEELGLIGTVGLLIVFLILIYRCVKITLNAPDKFSFFIGTGITTMFSLQVLMNYAVATSSMPATGVTLPLISYGGTSVVIMLGAIGIMLNISKNKMQKT